MKSTLEKVSHIKEKKYMLYTYQCFGLICTSTFEIPSFLPVKANLNQQIDFEIVEGEIDSDFEVKGNNNEEVIVQEHQHNFYVYVAQAGKYKIQNGNKIIVEPNSQYWNDVIHNMLVECLPLLLLQRGLIPYHLSGVIDPIGGVWLFGGQSGSGKSTACLMLKEKGYRFFADDIVILSIENGQVYATAGYPLIKFWPDTLNIWDNFNLPNTFKIYTYLEKLGIHFHSEFHHEKKQLKGLVFLGKKSKKVNSVLFNANEQLIKLFQSIHYLNQFNHKNKTNAFVYSAQIIELLKSSNKLNSKLFEI